MPADTFVAGFLGNPPMNLIPATVTDAPGGRDLRFGPNRLSVPAARTAPLAPGSAVTLGLRPEHLAPVQDASDPGALWGEVVTVEPLGAETLVQVHLP